MSEALLFLPAKVDLRQSDAARQLFDVLKDQKLQGLEADTHTMELADSQRGVVTTTQLYIYQNIFKDPHRMLVEADTVEQLKSFVKLLKAYVDEDTPGSFELVGRSIQFSGGLRPKAKVSSYVKNQALEVDLSAIEDFNNKTDEEKLCELFKRGG